MQTFIFVAALEVLFLEPKVNHNPPSSEFQMQSEEMRFLGNSDKNKDLSLSTERFSISFPFCEAHNLQRS